MYFSASEPGKNVHRFKKHSFTFGVNLDVDLDIIQIWDSLSQMHVSVN